VDKFVKIAVIVAALMAGFGIFYHYVIHLPSIERDKIAAVEKEKTEAEATEAARKVQYESCKRTASQLYNIDWARACVSVANAKKADLQNCLTNRSIVTNPYMGEHYCRENFGGADPSEDCTLPKSRAESINKTLSDAEQQCLLEARGGL
jgi:hypothetical protein